MGKHQYDLPQDISDKENIARIIFSPYMIQDGRVSPTAFHLRDLRSGAEEYVSVIRHDYMVLTPENISRIRPPENNEIYGYALLNAGVCRNVSWNKLTTSVIAHPNKSFASHAGIHFSNNGTVIKGRGMCSDPSFIIVSTMLANKCVLKQFDKQK